MKTPALFAVEQPPAEFAALFAAAAAGGVRIGWLDLAATDALPAPLAEAAEAGLAKAVAVSPRGALAWKRRTGEAVLRDLLREHFLGYGVVLVRGRAGGPSLAAEGAGIRLTTAAGESRWLAAPELLAEILRPRHRA